MGIVIEHDTRGRVTVELAEAIGITQKLVSDYERGRV